MKRIFLTLIIGLCSLAVSNTLHAQNSELSVRERIARRQAEQNKPEGLRPLTVREQIMNESQVQTIGNAPWVREIYRFLDLTNDKNASLYYPVRPIGDNINFFTLIFDRVLAGELNIYEYQLDGSARLTEEYQMKIDSAFFYKFDIPFDVVDGKYKVDPSSVPSEDIRGYYVKEAWYFDKNNSTVDVKTVAVCPVMMYQEYDATGMSRFPLFWFAYEDIQPYAAETPMMVSSLNNAWTKTINDFFLDRNFDGEIYKTTNMTNKTLAEQFEGDSLKKEQKKIELELKKFNENLWVYNDSVAIAKRALANEKSTKKDKKEGTLSATKNANEAPDRATVQKQAKQQSKSPARSMRNRKRN